MLIGVEKSKIIQLIIESISKGINFVMFLTGRMNGSRKQSIVYAVRDYQPLKESSVACSATTTDGARSLTMRCGLITDVSVERIKDTFALNREASRKSECFFFLHVDIESITL